MTAPDYAHQLSTRGFFVVHGVYDAIARAEIAAVLEEALGRLRPASPDAWGREIVPLLEHAPSMGGHLDAPVLAEALRDAFGEAPQRIFAGARFTSLGTTTFLPWHHHLPDGAGTDGRWSPNRPGSPERIERVIGTAYLDGATRENGLLHVWPRREREPWRAPFDWNDRAWPGQIDLELAPGDVAVWDEATYHSAHRVSGPRRIFGGVWQRHSVPSADDGRRR